MKTNYTLRVFTVWPITK